MRHCSQACDSAHRPVLVLLLQLGNDEPPHIHVQRDREVAKFWLNPVRLAWNRRYANHELTHVRKLVEASRDLLLRGWITSAAPAIEFDATAVDVAFDRGMLRVKLADGREIAAPLEYFPRLRDASQEELARWELIGHGYGIHWESLDEHVSVKGLIRLH